MAEESGKSGLEEVFRKKEEAVKAKEAQEKKDQQGEQEAKTAEDIIPEQEVAKSAEKAKLEIKTLFLSDESQKLILGALDKLLESQKSDVEQAGTKTREELKALFEGTKGKLDAFEGQPGVKEIYEPLSKLFENKKVYLNAINLEQYGIAEKGSEQGYWVKIQEELTKAKISEEDIKKVQKILGLEQDGKVGPKTIEATWKLLTDKDKPVANIIRQKGETVKTKEGEKLVEAILASDAEKEAKAKEELAKTQPEAPAVTPPAAEDEKKVTEQAPEEVTEKEVRERFAWSYDYVKPEIIQEAQVAINEFRGHDGRIAHAIVATYTGENGEKVVYDGIYEIPPANDHLEITAKKSNLNKYIQEGKEAQLQSEWGYRIKINYLEEETPAQAEQKPAENDKQKKASVFDESGKVRTEFTQEEINKLCTHSWKEKIPDAIKLMGFDLLPDEVDMVGNFNPGSRAKVEVDLVTDMDIPFDTVDPLVKNGKIKSRTILMPEPKRGDLVGVDHGGGSWHYKVYDGTWGANRREGERDVKITS